MTDARQTDTAKRAGIAVAVALIAGTLVRLRTGVGSWTPVIVAAVMAGLATLFVFGLMKAADSMAAKRPGTVDEIAMRRQRARSAAIGIALAVLVAIFYSATIIRLGGNALNRPL